MLLLFGYNSFCLAETYWKRAVAEFSLTTLLLGLQGLMMQAVWKMREMDFASH